LIESLNSGRLRPGDRVREVEIADWLGISRTPVREALHRLESDEILVKNERGLIVPFVEDSQVLELYAMREVLEGAAAALAARHASDAELQMLEQILAECSRTAESDATRHAVLNKEFHAIIYRAADNRYLTKSLNSLQDAIQRLRSTTFARPGRPKEALKEHRSILRHMRRQDSKEADDAARHHIRQALRHRMLLLQERRERPT
jgi:DNA-binding GntR family transcriptional regulator